MRLTPEHLASFPGSSAVEQPAVNRLVAGSNPARGANKISVLRQSAARNLKPKWRKAGVSLFGRPTLGEQMDESLGSAFLRGDVLPLEGHTPNEIRATLGRALAEYGV